MGGWGWGIGGGGDFLWISYGFPKVWGLWNYSYDYYLRFGDSRVLQGTPGYPQGSYSRAGHCSDSRNKVYTFSDYYYIRFWDFGITLMITI